VRPKNSRLDQTKAERVLGVVMPDWRQGLWECMERLER
jgi:dTDP-4-dehydrorhamnose reductase